MTNPTYPVAYILAHPRVRELRPGWYEQAECLMSQEVRSHYTGPNFISDDDLGALLALADEVAALGFRADVEWTGDAFRCEMICRARENGPVVYWEGYGPTRNEAVINALYTALGGK